MCPAHVQPGMINRYRTYGSGRVAGEARSGLDAASKAALLAPFSVAQARDFPEQLGAAVQVLHAAVTLHPSLAEALLLPTSLSDPGSSDSNKVRRSLLISWPIKHVCVVFASLFHRLK